MRGILGKQERKTNSSAASVRLHIVSITEPILLENGLDKSGKFRFPSRVPKGRIHITNVLTLPNLLPEGEQEFGVRVPHIVKVVRSW